MGCIKLDILDENLSSLKVVHNSLSVNGESCAGAYLFGFNGQMKDNEIYGEGNLYTAQFWEYDSRIGRRWNLDPKPITGISEYACFAGNPIMYKDVIGDTIRFASDANSQIIKNRVMALKSKSMVFAAIYDYLDSRPEIINVSANDIIVQTEFQKVTKGRYPNTKAGGFTEPGGNNDIYYSEIYASTDEDLTEEFVHCLQYKFYNPHRQTNSMESEADLFNTVVAIESTSTSSLSGQGKILDEIKTSVDNFTPAVQNYNGTLFLTLEEMTKQNSLEINYGSSTFSVYSSDYLSSFSQNNQNQGAGYSGSQQSLAPDAYNSVINMVPK